MGSDRLRAEKRGLRARMRELRGSVPNREEAGAAAWARLQALAVHSNSRTMSCYVGFGPELPTRDALAGELAAGRRRLAVPYCVEGELGLWSLASLDELEPGTWGILEPPPRRWHERERMVGPEELDLIVVPGLAFAPDGARLGNGMGYYDRLLPRLGPGAALIGLAFECQVIPSVPTSPRDYPVDLLVTEARVRDCRVHAPD